MSMNCPVPSCTRPMPGHLTVCRACSAGMLRDLADVPSLDMHLDITIVRQARLGDGGGGRSGETALAWDQRAREARNVLRSALVGWVRVLSHGVRPMPGPICEHACEHRTCIYITLGRAPADTLPDMAHWLLRHRRLLIHHKAAPEAVHEICDAVREARRAIDRPADRIYAGPCNRCSRDLYARPGSPIVDCVPCNLEYDVEPRRRWMRRETESMRGSATWVAAVATSLGYQVTPAMVRGLALRLRLFPRGTDQLGRALYRVGDLRHLLDGGAGEELAGPVCAACHHPTCRRIRADDLARST